MKKLIVLFFFVSQGLVAQQNIKVMTYNIRLDVTQDGKNAWQHRKDSVCHFIRKEHPDVIGMQEVLHHQLLDVMNGIHGYAYAGVGRFDGKEKGEYSPVIYNSDVFEWLDGGNFWLSETPEIAGSKGWDAACERICSWVRLQDKRSGSQLVVMNTHFDHIGLIAREKSARLILDSLRKISENQNVILMGDFNSPLTEKAYQTLAGNGFSCLSDARNAVVLEGVQKQMTFTGFNSDQDDDALIDFIFTAGKLKVTDYQVLTINSPDFFFSDHLPVTAKMILP